MTLFLKSAFTERVVFFLHGTVRNIAKTDSVSHHSVCNSDALLLPVSLIHSWSNSTLQPSSKWSAQIATAPLPSFCINLRSSDALQRYNSHILSHTAWLHLQGQCTHMRTHTQAKFKIIYSLYQIACLKPIILQNTNLWSRTFYLANM